MPEKIEADLKPGQIEVTTIEILKDVDNIDREIPMKKILRPLDELKKMRETLLKRLQQINDEIALYPDKDNPLDPLINP